jgi:hypothetical protein
LFKQAVSLPKTNRRKIKYGFDSPDTPGVRMKKFGDLFGNNTVKRKIKHFEDLGSPKLKQSRTYVRESERRARLVITDTEGAAIESGLVIRGSTGLEHEL